MKYWEGIRDGTQKAMGLNPNLHILGEGVADYKGLFGTTLQAHGSYPDRVHETPLSETMLTGALAGMASNGMDVIYVHARSEFSLIGMEHLINTICKWPELHGGQQLQILIRMLVGRGWGQGPTHSQSFHGIFDTVPGLRVFYPVKPETAAGLIVHWNEHRIGPTVMIEPRRMYEWERQEEPGKPGERDLTLVSFGDAYLDCVWAARILEPYGINACVYPIEDFKWDAQRLPQHLPMWIVDTMPARQMAFTLAGALEVGPEIIKGILAGSNHAVPTAFMGEQSYYPTAYNIAKAVLAELQPAGLNLDTLQALYREIVPREADRVWEPF